MKLCHGGGKLTRVRQPLWLDQVHGRVQNLSR